MADEDDNPDQDALADEWAAALDEAGDGGDGGDGGGGDDGGGEDAATAAGGDGGDGGGGDAAAAAGDASGDAAPRTEAQTARVLNQDEIDSLLGFGGEGEGSGHESGMQAIVNSAMVAYERLPMLEVVFDRLVRLMTTSLRNFTSDNVEVSLDHMSSSRFGDYLNSIPLPAMLAVFKAPEWDNYGLITVDSSLIYSVVDVLLGGRRGTAPMRIEGRPYTTIERNLIERMVELVLQDLKAAFAPISQVSFAFERLEINPRFATIARPANAAVVAKLRVDMEDRGGRMEFLLPYATLEPVRELLLQMFMGEKFGRDSIWESHLATELWATQIDMRAVLDEQPVSLGDIMEWTVGSKLMLNAGPQSTVVLRCGDIPMFTGKMGRRNQKIAIRIDNRVDHGR
jgi:flagellar motor switch protein FliM